MVGCEDSDGIESFKASLNKLVGNSGNIHSREFAAILEKKMDDIYYVESKILPGAPINTVAQEAVQLAVRLIINDCLIFFWE